MPTTHNDFAKTAFLFEIVTVLAVAFLFPIVTSCVYVFTEDESWRHAFSWNPGTAVVYQIPPILLVFYITRHRSESVKRYGLNVSWSTVVFGCGLFLALWTILVILAFLLSHLNVIPPSGGVPDKTFHIIWNGQVMLYIIFICLAGFNEDFIGRAYLIRRLEDMGMRTSVAVIISVGIATVWHLYAGAYWALFRIPMFLLMSIYFVWRRDITAVVVAHVCYNLVWLWQCGIG